MDGKQAGEAGAEGTTIEIIPVPEALPLSEILIARLEKVEEGLAALRAHLGIPESLDE